MERDRDPLDRDIDRNVDSTYVETSSDSGVTWFIVGALVIAAGVLAYLYFGDNANTTAQSTPPAVEAPADTGRASTPAAPAEPAAPAAPAPAPAAPATPAAPSGPSSAP
jgi:hypothetical protein